MKYEQIISKGIAANSYFIAASDEAVVVDPRRDIDIYLDLAREHNVKITAIFDTHRNEDFVNGSPQLAHFTEAEIFHGNKIDFKYGIPAKDQQEIKIDDLIFTILETPGHSPESISIVMREEDKKDPFMVFTGDTLFAGEVGRIDFYRDAEKQKMAAEWIYDSIFNKLLSLPDGTVVAPAHGAGSICGGGISGLPFSTIGYEKETNPRLKMSKKEFINFKATEKFEIAPNMSVLEKLNLEGPPILANLIQPKALTVEEVKKYQADQVQIVDVREPESYAGGHIPNTINIWKNGLPTFAIWMLDYSRPIVLIKSVHQEIDLSIRYLIRLGFDNIIGYLNGFRDWYMQGEPFEKTNVWSVHELNDQLTNDDVFILDVRTSHNAEENGQIKGSNHIFLGHLSEQLDKIPKDKTICVYCDSGFKTFTGVSYLLKKGYKKVVGIYGSMSAWKNAGCPLED
jgi:hydroxyacylglutathione hydrolase